MWTAILWLHLGARAEDGATTEHPKGWVDGKPGKGFTLHTADDAFTMNVKGRMQIRSTVWVPTEEGEEPVDEIIVRRARLSLSGHAYDEDLTYLMQLAFSNRDEESDLPRPLLDAWVDYGKVRDLQIRVGQQLVPFSRARINSSSSLGLVDRSVTVSELNLDRDVGVMFHSDDLGGVGGRLGYGVGVFGGDGRNRLGEGFGLLTAGRVVIRPMGEFDDMVEADLERRSSPKLAIGFSGGYNLNSNRARSTSSTVYEVATFDYLNAGADLMFKWHGVDLSGEFLYRQADQDSSTDPDTGLEEFSRSGYGWYAQAGEMLTKKLMVGERFGQLVPFEGTDPEFTEEQELGGGLTYFLHGHALKTSADWFYLFGEEMAGGEHQARLELQVTM